MGRQSLFAIIDVRLPSSVSDAAYLPVTPNETVFDKQFLPLTQPYVCVEMSHVHKDFL